MIVYSATKQQFNDDVILNRIADVVVENLRLKHVSGGSPAESRAFQNSFHFSGENQVKECVLHSQFRCNGSDQFIQLINNILQTGEPVDVDLSELNFDLRVFDDPNELRDTLRELNKSIIKPAWRRAIATTGM